MKNYLLTLLVAVMAIVLGTSCNDPTVIGADLLADDFINASRTDTITIEASMIYGDSVRTYATDQNARLNRHIVANYQDPIFGGVKASFAFQVLSQSTAPPFTSNTAELDSMVLVLPYDSLGLYGDYTQPITISLKKLENQLDDERDYYSDEEISALSSNFAQYTITPQPFEEYSFQQFVENDDTGEIDTITTVQPPQLRLPLPTGFAIDIFKISADVFEDDTLFLQNLPGIAVEIENQEGGMISFDLDNANAGIEIHSTFIENGDTTVYEDNLVVGFNSVKQGAFEHDYTGSLAKEFVEDPTITDSLVLVQSMEGIHTILEFPHLSAFKGNIINKAELVITALRLDEDEAIYDPVDQLIISEVRGEGDYAIVDDVLFALQDSELDILFGGDPEANGLTPATYRMNITTIIQDIVSGNTEINQLIITPLSRGETSSRVVLAGPNHPDFPMKLNLVLTKPQ